MMERAHDPELKIAERYFLGELTDDEAEAFEAHYFECPRCAEYVVEELHMMESGREVAKTIAKAPANVVPLVPRRRREWLTAAAAAVFVLAIGAPMLMRDAARPSVDLATSDTIQFSADRAAAPEAQVFPAGKTVVLDFDIEPSDAASFVVSVRDVSNEVTDKEIAITAEQAIEPVSLVLRELPAGTYNVVIEGIREDGNRSLIATKSIEVRGESR